MPISFTLGHMVGLGPPLLVQSTISTIEQSHFWCSIRHFAYRDNLQEHACNKIKVETRRLSKFVQPQPVLHTQDKRRERVNSPHQQQPHTSAHRSKPTPMPYARYKCSTNFLFQSHAVLQAFPIDAFTDSDQSSRMRSSPPDYYLPIITSRQGHVCTCSIP
ncbi:hypothetical protein P153DRAFT_367973 [Dothidotthia symphoricarpi CBS 119687]|uniref:Uncharacterized protein n=1 Tax=Dothidotthia symphoricarpi CBS 119687 TaxID=1392245 RepID=A0A6A6A951_9PLEO|nr:uncharacterized protein P153DRAFT_367973 [Dothidotthia symphoricarpi CBS 119687]KAF2128076.1 hypothetical protein P153DRAFT_367973 [Dothidotthia symphoricarpi CBS 119687]